MSEPPVKRRRPLHPVVRWVFDGIGMLFFAIGFIGIFVPLWPTTIFWIIAVPFFLKTRPGAVRPLLRVPVVGPAISWFLRWRPWSDDPLGRRTRGAARRGRKSGAQDR